MHAQLAAYTVSIGPLSKECRMNHDERAIRELIAKWLRATAEGDVAQLQRLLDDDVAFIMPGPTLMRGREASATALRTVLATQCIEASNDIQEIVVSGEL